MSAWRDKLGKVQFADGKRGVGATFRGAAFMVEMSELGGGRRNALHEYPGKNEAFAEDMGRRAQSFPVEGYVLGPDYLAARDLLITALNSDDGPGELVHPYHGKRRVAVDSFRVSERAGEGGIAYFGIDFIETPAKPLQPTAIPDAAAKVATSASSARTSVEAEFLAKYSVGPLLSSVTAMLTSVTLAINNVLNTISMEMQQLAMVKRKLNEFADSVVSLANSPEDIIADLAEIFDLLDIGAKLLSVYDFTPGVRPAATTPNRLEEQTNYDALQNLVQRLTVIRVAELAPSQTYASYQEAVAARDAILDLLDEQAEVAEDDAFPALLQLRADLVKAIPGEDGDLPQLIAHTPPFTIPSLVLAQNLYGHLDLEADVLTRNSVRNPLFVAGGAELEVLSDG